MERVPSRLALGIAVTLEIAGVFWLNGNLRAAIWVAALGVGALVWMWTGQRWRVLLVFLNALLLSLPVARHWGGGGEVEGGNSADGEAAREARGGGAAIVADDTFPGVILFPETKPAATLVPPLPALSSNVFGPNQRDPLSIPFFGSYWLYKRPQTALPKRAKVMSGEPDRMRFRSTDLKEMVMEAHQNLGVFIDLRCCRSIELAIRNADRYPSSVSLELRLVNTAEAGKPSLALGPMPLLSRASREGRREGVLETLRFDLPPSPSPARFDEFSVRFVLGGWRSSHSAAVAIDRFILVPKN